MKSLLALILVTFTLSLAQTSHAEDLTLIVEPAAKLKICPPKAAGCANKIVINEIEYIISYDEGNNTDNAITNLIQEMIAACRAKKLAVSPIFIAEGYIAKEKGHFPNPMAEFTVFKISYLADVNLP